MKQNKFGGGRKSAVPGKEVVWKRFICGILSHCLGYRIPRPVKARTMYSVHAVTRTRGKAFEYQLEKEVFRCPRCGASGGIFDLYALYTGIPRDEVRKAILAQLGVPENASRPRQKILPKADTECPLTDIDARHATYSALLSKLTLASDHRENLLGRGLTDADIGRLGYKTTPVVGMTQIAKQLQFDGLYLAGVPGFYRDDSGAWTFIHEKRGILIPVRDRYGRIQGLQIRRDNVEKRKFRWVSSTEKKTAVKLRDGRICPVLYARCSF